MIDQIYFADEDLKDVEKAIYEMSLNEDLKELNSEHLLERLFLRGFGFKGWDRAKINRKIIKYLKNWVQFELEKLDKEVSSLNSNRSFRKEGLLLLKQYLRLSNYSEMTFQNAYEIAFKLIREPHIKKFLSVLYLARFYPTLEDLVRARKTREQLGKLLRERINEEDSGFCCPSQHLDKKEKLDEQERSSEIPEEESLEIEDTSIENSEEEINLEEFSPYEVFITVIDIILNGLPDLSREEIREIFSKETRRLDRLCDRELINGLLYISQLEILYMINEDEYMKNMFYGIDLDDVESLCENFDDLSSKDCQLVYLVYLWMLVQSSGADLKTFEFVEPKIKFSNNGKILVDLIKEELERRKALEKERLAIIRKKQKSKKIKKRN